MALKTRKWDVAEHLGTSEMIAAYLEAVFEDGDPQLIVAALGDVARARGMSALARETGLSRESLYRALSTEGNPEFSTVLKVLRAFGVTLEARVPPQVRRPAKQAAKGEAEKAKAVSKRTLPRKQSGRAA